MKITNFRARQIGTGTANQRDSPASSFWLSDVQISNEDESNRNTLELQLTLTQTPGCVQYTLKM